MAKTKVQKEMKKELKRAREAQRNALYKFAAAQLKKLELRNKRVIESIGTNNHLDLIRRQQQGPLLGQSKDHDIWFYFRRMKGETNELQTALKQHDIHCSEKTALAVISEACDVANFAAAIAEKAVEDTR